MIIGLIKKLYHIAAHVHIFGQIRKVYLFKFNFNQNEQNLTI